MMYLIHSLAPNPSQPPIVRGGVKAALPLKRGKQAIRVADARARGNWRGFEYNGLCGMMERKAQRGFSLVSAIFLLVVLAGLGAAMVSFSTTQNQLQALDVMGSRAYQAANAGIEWAAYNVQTVEGMSAPAAVVFAPGTATALAGNLADFAVTVSIGAIPASDAANAGGTLGTVWSYDITASAVWGAAGTENRVERVLNAKMKEKEP